MRKRLIIIVLTVMAIAYFSENKLLAKRSNGLDLAPNTPQLEPITKEDKILILAPHPDDEALSLGGLIQKAVKVGADVRVTYLTSGEHNQLAFIVYEKRFVIKQKALIKMGELRQKEAISAMKFFGVPEENLIFLGYPDFGTLVIFLRNWGDSKPFKNMLTRVSNVPYENALTPNAPYKGESILADIESVLTKYKPTKIFVTNPVDTNRDHKALYLFLQVALWDLKGKIPQPQVIPYLIHCYGWPKPRNYHPELYLNIPKLLGNSQIEWRSSDLSDEEIKQKEKAIRLYRSQCADSAFYLTAFARKNELFGDYPVIELDNPMVSGERGGFKIATTFRDRTVTYGRSNNDLIINVFLKKGAGGIHKFYVNLVSYNPTIKFSQMPKLKISVDADSIKLLDRGRFIKPDKMDVEQREHSVSIKMPLNMLGDPQSILSSVNTYTENFSSDLNAWRIIKIK